MVSLGTKRPAFRGAEGHHLAHRHADVGGRDPFGLIAPAAFFILRVNDEFDGLGQFFPQFGPRRHAVTLGQERGSEAVSVHGALGHRRGGLGDETALLRAGQQVVDRAGHVLAIGAAAGRRAGAHEGHAAQSGNGHIAAQRAGAERAVVVLPRGQPGQAFVDRPMRGRRDQRRRRLLRARFGRRQWQSTKPQQQRNQGECKR